MLLDIKLVVIPKPLEEGRETVVSGSGRWLVVDGMWGGRKEGNYILPTHPPNRPTPPSTSYPRALFSTVWPLSSHEVDGVRKEKERLTDDCRW